MKAPFSRLLKKAHLRRWSALPLAAAYFQYASLGHRHSALHLGPFEQPGEKRGFPHPARFRQARLDGVAKLGAHP